MKAKFILLLIIIIALSGENLSLNTLIDSALENNAQIKAREYELKASQAARFSVYSGILSTADLGFRYTYLGEVPYLAFPEELSSLMPEMGAIEMGKHDNYDLTLTLQQPLFTGFALYRGIKLSSIDVEVKTIEFDKTSSEIALNVKKGYFNLIRSISALSTARMAHESITAHYQDLENLYESGLIVKNDILQARVALSEMELNIVRIEHAIELTKENLTFITSIPSERIRIDTMLYFEPVKFNQEVAESLALLHNFDMKALDAGHRASEQNIGMAYSKFMPTLALAGNYHYKNPTQDLDESWEDSWDVSIIAQLNVFSWGRDIAKACEAKNQMKAFEMNMLHARNMIMQGVNAIMIGMKEAELSIEISNDEIFQAEENLRIINDRFKAGDATNADVLDAESALYRARNNRINAICDHNIKKAELHSIIGYVK